MDQGMAALIAGLTGMAGALGGAVAGAIGAVRGAKVGAERTAEATRQQVQDQAVAEHSHWLRQQRQTAYSAFIAANQAAERAAEAAMNGTYDPQARDSLEALDRARNDLNDISSQVFVLGPDTMITASRRVFQNLLLLMLQLGEAANAVDITQEHQDRIDEAWDAFAESGQLFQQGARDVLVRPAR